MMSSLPWAASDGYAPLSRSRTEKSLVFQGRLENLAKIAEFVTEQARLAGLDDAEIYAVQLAVDEAATNIIEHTYRGESQGDITCQCEPIRGGLRVTLQDRGDPFDPTSVPDPVFDMPLEYLKSRGLGVFLMRQMMDKIAYAYSPAEGNVLTMVKLKKKGAATAD